jgi:hypothetical protein|tara:strand:- start:108 stop:986 length:879 start_codon:yes stop_codon:yes gene_type:complete
MKNIAKYLVITGLITSSFVFGISSGTYKHFPFELLYKIKNGTKLPTPTPSYSGRTYNTDGLISKEIDISDNTGIYLTYGQSNSVNSGELGYIVQREVYQFILGNTFDYKDPSLGGTGYGGSVWGMVGDKLIEQGFHDEVIFSNSGWGGKKIEELKKGELFGFLIFNYTTLIQKYGRVDGILFHQGESNNSSEGIKHYYNDFSQFISNLKEKGIEIPVYLSRVSFCGKKIPINKNLTDIQNQLITDFDIIKEGPNTDLLSLELDRSQDYCHFSLEGYDKFSDMWVKSLTNNKK